MGYSVTYVGIPHKVIQRTSRLYQLDVVGGEYTSGTVVSAGPPVVCRFGLLQDVDDITFLEGQIARLLTFECVKGDCLSSVGFLGSAKVWFGRGRPRRAAAAVATVSYTHLRAHET